MYKEYKGNTENGRGRVGESTAPRRSSPLEGQKTTAIEHSGPTLNTSARHFALERTPARRGPNIKKGPGAQGLKLNHARGDAGAVAGGLLLEGVVVDDPALGAGLVADGAHDDEGHAVEIDGLHDGAALHLAAQVAEGREDALLLFRGRDDSVGKVLSKGVVRRRKTSMTDYRLEQVADYLCTIELALVKYEAKENGETYNKFFGGIGSFKRNWLKQARSKLI